MSDPASDMWRVDVGGMPLTVRGEHARDYLIEINQKMARMKLALHKLKWIDGSTGVIAKKGLGI